MGIDKYAGQRARPGKSKTTTVVFGKPCDATTKAHADAMRIVEFLLDRDGRTDLTQEEIARKIGMVKPFKPPRNGPGAPGHVDGGGFAIDRSRYKRACNHLTDAVDADCRACCGYRIHYRRTGAVSTLALADPSGDLGSHARTAMAELLGWMSRERQHHTENQRQIVQFQTLADHALANGDKEGYRLLQVAIIDLDRDGTVLPQSMAHLQAWAQQIDA